jgi:hypothetical protein
METLLIGINGRKGSGKNTAGEVIQRWGMARGLNVHCRGFADKMKVSAMRSLGVPAATNMHDAIILADELKESGFINFEIPSLSYAQGITGREYLKYFGTEGHRDVFGPNFWVDELLPIGIDWRTQWYDDGGVFPDIAVITDVRFVSEVERIHSFGGEVIEIHRPEMDTGDNHASEQPLPRKWITYVIENDSSLEAFETEVNSWMTANYHMRFVDVLSD